MTIPVPVDEDEWSEDEYDGYVDSDVEDQGECTNESEMRNEDVELGEGVLGDSESPTQARQVALNLSAMDHHFTFSRHW